MKDFILNILPRIKQFSETLDKKEFFVDLPWVFIDESQNKQKYIFKRDGNLIMSLNGHVTIGKWEYISSAKSLLIDRINDKILLNQNFIDSAVMILNKDGDKEENLILANENIIPDLDIKSYLQKLFYRKNNIRLLKVDDLCLELHNYQGVLVGTKVTIDGKNIPDKIFESDDSKYQLEIQNSAILGKFSFFNYNSSKGDLKIGQRNSEGVEMNDLVYKDDLPAPDGKYKLGFMNYIIVKSGRVVRKPLFG